MYIQKRQVDFKDTIEMLVIYLDTKMILIQITKIKYITKQHHFSN